MRRLCGLFVLDVIFAQLCLSSVNIEATFSILMDQREAHVLRGGLKDSVHLTCKDIHCFESLRVEQILTNR